MGEHRKRAFSDWFEIEKEVTDDLQRELIILIGNFHRQISEGETKMRLLRIAKCLEAKGVAKKDICSTVAAIVPYGDSHVRHLLPAEYKMASKGHASKPVQVKGTRASAPLVPQNPVLGKTTEQELSLSQSFSFPFADCQCKGCPHQKECY